MINRYSRPEMANIWSEENKYRAWLEVEILADEAWAELGEIPKEDVALIREKRTLTSTVFWKLSRRLATMWWLSRVRFLKRLAKSASGSITA